MLKVAICVVTRNNSLQLARTLDALADLQKPIDVDLRFVVCNNGSTDGTRHVIGAFMGQVRVPVKRLYTGSVARSTAMQVCLDEVSKQGDDIAVVFIDDSEKLEPNFLVKLAESLK